jgi:nucleoside-diphosphate kinase
MLDHRFERRGYKIAALKMIHASKEHVEKHYADLKDKPFFGGLTSFMCSGPVVAIVFEGKDVSTLPMQLLRVNSDVI